MTTGKAILCDGFVCGRVPESTCKYCDGAYCWKHIDNHECVSAYEVQAVNDAERKSAEEIKVKTEEDDKNSKS